jgi:hypothetical protein
MKVPTSGTSVFSPVAYTGNQSTSRLDVDAGFVVDAGLFMNRPRTDYTTSMFTDRLRGPEVLSTNSTGAASSVSGYLWFDDQNGIDVGQIGDLNPVVAGIGQAMVLEAFKRAPSFFDVVCYTGNGTAGRTINHNLGVVPEMMIVKSRSGAYSWQIYTASRGPTEVMTFTSDPSSASSFPWNNTAPTSTVFTVGGANGTNSTLLATYVAYLFATCAGVSKVFSYTGNGSSQTINCGFTAGSRWIMIKRTDSTGDWYVWDSARGIIAGNDPHLSLNTTAAEVTTDDSVDTDNTGFIVNQLAATNINVTSATYIGIAIA